MTARQLEWVDDMSRLASAAVTFVAVAEFVDKG